MEVLHGKIQDLFLTLLFIFFCSCKSLLKILIFVTLCICRLMLELTNDNNGVLLCFVRLGCLCFYGMYVGCGCGRQLVLHHEESCEGLGFNSPTSYYCVQICVIANKISNIKNLCVSVCAYPLLV
jgi:hypothetical protein